MGLHGRAHIDEQTAVTFRAQTSLFFLPTLAHHDIVLLEGDWRATRRGNVPQAGATFVHKPRNAGFGLPEDCPRTLDGDRPSTLG